MANSGSLARLASTTQQHHLLVPPLAVWYCVLFSSSIPPFKHEDCRYMPLTRRRRRCIFPCFYEGVCL